MDEVASEVRVNFLIPGLGSEKQTYDLFSAQDIATWRANCKLTAAVQTSVKTTKTVRATENNLEKLKQAQEKSKFIFNTMMRERD